MVGNVNTKFYIIMPTLTFAVATLSVNKLNDGRQCEHEVYIIVSTLTVVVATLSVNKIKMIVGNVYSMFYSVYTYG